MQNQAVIAALQARPVPPDLQCYLSQETADAIAQNIAVVGLASQIASPTGVAVPVTNNTGQTALNLAQTLQTQVQALQAERTPKRIVAQNQGIPSGNSDVPYTFSPALPDTNYEIRAFFIATAGHVTIPKWRVLSGSISTTGFTLIFDDVPAACLVTVVAESNIAIV